ncbi:hypothetical protein ACGFX2_21095 [Streptomyces goshikiensis]|uniref:hypothetical protein n=1 Tax=Streptomyces goshikiensis TaxID=1942 RepID=UPI0037132896
MHVDRDGRDVCRVGASGDGSAVSLRDAAGRTVWEGTAAPGAFKRAAPYLTRDVDHAPTWEGDCAAVVG